MQRGGISMKKAVFKIITSCIVGTSLFFSPQLATKSYATLTVRTYMDTTETAIYGIPTTFTERRPAIESRIETYFSARNISVNVTSSNLDIYSTPASQCAENAPNYNYTVRHGCACYSNTQCDNGTHHHSNAQVYRNSFPNPTNAKTAHWLITAAFICDNNPHHGLNGVTWTNSRKIISCDYDYKVPSSEKGDDVIAFASKTAIHEIGHLYGVADHYSVLPDQYPNCMWGSNHSKYTVASYNKTCLRCATTLSNNKNKRPSNK